MNISVIIPTYKPNLEYLNKTVNSLFGQSGISEIIIVLNGPKDPYYFYLNELNAKVTLLYNKNKGVSSARNYGLEQATGDYILFIDDDDWVSEHFTKSVGILKEGAVLMPNFQGYNEEKQLFHEDYIGSKILEMSKVKFNYWTYRSFFSQVCGKIIPVEVIGNNRFNEKVDVSEDALFMFEISHKIKDIIIDKEIVYFRRIRGNSVSNRKLTQTNLFKQYFVFIYYLTLSYVKNPLKLNFFFFISRILASTKFLINRLQK